MASHPPEPRLGRRLKELGRAAARGAYLHAPLLLATAWLAVVTVREVLRRAGGPAAALDDAYIHFQYARAIAEGHPFRFHASAPYSTGATSWLWPLLLAPFWRIGFREEALMWPAWALSYGALALLAHETYAFTRPLAGRHAALGAAAMVLGFAGLGWYAASGMEVVPFAWLLMRAARRSSEWVEGGEHTAARERELVLLAFASVLMRPEGALASVGLALALAVHPLRPTWRGRLVLLPALLAPAVMPLVSRALTGSLASNTAQVKLLVGNPYYTGAALREVVLGNVRHFFDTLLPGGLRADEFIPPGGVKLAMAGVVSVVVLGVRTGRVWRATAVLVLAMSILVPCTYVTFLWNRLRYLFPFVPGWLIALACGARLLGDVAGALRPRWRLATPLLAFAIAGMLAARLPGVIDDVAQSASGIERQQVALGKWARTHLPADARIGVNDTGAVAYFGERETFDVVGLTTNSEGRHWVAGVASRWEHYERLGVSRLPTHFIVYPEWLGCDALLGAELTRATVVDATILGGQTMRVHVADYTSLGRAELPAGGGHVTDTLDVADLESEAAHDYQLLGARDGEQALHQAVVDGRVAFDGGRTQRSRERFLLDLTGASALRIRLVSAVPGEVHVRVAGADVARVPIEPADGTEGDWSEVSVPLSRSGAKATGGRVPVELEAVPPMTMLHYWAQED